MRQFVCWILLAALAASVLAGCGVAPQQPTATAAPTPTVAAVPATWTPAPVAPTPARTVAPTATPTVALTIAPTAPPVGNPAVHPAGARTGVPEVDAVMQAFLGNEVSARRKLVRYLTTPCTTAFGMGGPPKCAAGEANGTPVTVFPFLGGEGEFVRQDAIDRILQFEVVGLWGVFRVPATAYRETYWPAGEYGIVLASRHDFSAYWGAWQQAVVYVQGGSVVRIARSPLQAAWPPNDAAGGTGVLAPVGAPATK